jgi:L-ribulose-5-phosphate 3-epimerase
VQRGVNAYAFPEGTGPAQLIEQAAAAGFETVEFAIPEEGDWSVQSLPAEAARWAARAGAAGLGTPTLVSNLFWKYPLSSSDPDRRRTGEAILRHLLESAAAAGAGTVLVVPGVVTAEEPYDEVWRRSQESLAAAAPLAERLGVRIGVENVWNRFLLSPLEMARYVDEIGSRSVGVYFDIGNHLFAGFPDQWVRILGPRIFAVHAKDFSLAIGTRSGFVPLLYGDVPWRRVVLALRAIGYAGPLTAEVPPAGHGAARESLAEINRALRHIIALGEEEQ